MKDYRSRLIKKSLPQLKKLATEVFNEFIRERDKDKGCISCGRYQVSAWHAGHYFSAGNHAGIRFDEINVNKQCKRCNVDLRGNGPHYRIGLVNRYGEDAVKALETREAWFKQNRNEVSRLTLIEIILKYKNK